ncbi:MAG: hypothetical protein M3480_05340 [Verrucomicrobiota bacterium]|nr:hypothetical protein [Chthoniobacterales bacterium]MDQ3414385.1 hypothetical protein [Verrucomicrobiota bacterium]
MARYRTLFLGPAGVGEAILAHAHLGEQVQRIDLVNSEPAGMLQRATKPPLGEAGKENPDRPKNYQPGAAQNRSGASTSR